MITTYAELQTAVGNWLNRSDLNAQIPDFITLCEARLNRTLRTPEMEEVVEQAVSSEATALPSDFLEARNLYIDGNPDIHLKAVTPQQLREEFPYENDGLPALYTIRGQEILIAPVPTSSQTLVFTYYKKIPALSDSNTSNWLLASHPDVYLWGALTMAEAYLKDDDRVGVWKGAWEEAIREVQFSGHKARIPSGPLSGRVKSAA